MADKLLPCDTCGTPIEEGDLMYIVRPLINYSRLPQRLRHVQRVIIVNKMLMAVSNGRRMLWGGIILSDGQEWSRFDTILVTSVLEYAAQHKGQIATANYTRPMTPETFLRRSYLRNVKVI